MNSRVPHPVDCSQSNFELDAFGWPIWPIADGETSHRLLEVLNSGRWSISGANTGSMPMEKRLADAFAAWMRMPYCVPTANGTSALLAALDALGVGAGDEVIVPGLTWVAPAIAVLQMNATPVFADIDAETLCICPRAVEQAITPRTRAIIVVHLYSSVANIEHICGIAERHGLAVIEDCAQSHGSEWLGKKVGSLGSVGVFSFHQGKPLTSGEGGAAVTHDKDLARRMAQLRANGRLYSASGFHRGTNGLDEIGEVQGTNMAMSEFHAALALDGLRHLDRFNTIRQEGARFLDAEISRIAGTYAVQRSAAVTRQSYYHYVVRFDAAQYGGRTASELAVALSEQLGFPWQVTYVPMNRHPLYRPLIQKRYRLHDEHLRSIDPARYPLPKSEEVHRTAVIAHHRMLLADPDQLQRVPEAFRKIQLLPTARGGPRVQPGRE